MEAQDIDNVYFMSCAFPILVKPLRYQDYFTHALFDCFLDLVYLHVFIADNVMVSFLPYLLYQKT